MMIVDRLTEKFLARKGVKQVVPATKSVAKAKPVKDPLDEAYARGRAAAGSQYWL